MFRRSFVEYAAALTRALRNSGSPAGVLRTHLDEFEVAALGADDHGNYIAANASACALTGYSRDELLQRRISDLVIAQASAEDPAALWDTFAAEGYQHRHVTLRRKDGSTVSVSYDAFGSIAPAINVSFMVPVDGDLRREVVTP